MLPYPAHGALRRADARSLQRFLAMMVICARIARREIAQVEILSRLVSTRDRRFRHTLVTAIRDIFL